MSVTIRDVARTAGVSITTVSRVLNDEPFVHAETRTRVLQASQQLDFRPNALARGLYTNRMRTLGLIVPDIANPFFAQGIDGCAVVAEQHGYNIFVASASDDPDRELRHIRAFVAQRVAGLILWVSDLTAVEVHDVMQRMKHTCPAVFIDRSFDPAVLAQMGYAALVVAQDCVGTLATAHLLDEGRQRIAHIGVTSLGSGQWVADQRLAGYRTALQSRHIQVDDRLIRRVAHATMGDGARATSDLLAQNTRPDAIFAYNDLIAVGALLACQQANLRVPEDIAIVGVDDTEMTAVTHPPLTTVRLTGERAAALVLDLMPVGVLAERQRVAPEADVAQPERPELVVRRSSTQRPLTAPSLPHIVRVGRDGRGPRVGHVGE